MAHIPKVNKSGSLIGNENTKTDTAQFETLGQTSEIKVLNIGRDSHLAFL